LAAHLRADPFRAEFRALPGARGLLALPSLGAANFCLRQNTMDRELAVRPLSHRGCLLARLSRPLVLSGDPRIDM
jgi:hypothetical protein